MKKAIMLLVIPCVLALTACQSQGLALLQAVSLEPCEIGEVQVQGNFDVSSNPLVTANVMVNMTEVHTPESIPRDCPGFTETAPDPPLDS